MRILNREAGEHWHQIETMGDSPTNDGRIQTVDDVAVERMVAEFNARAQEPDFPGLLIDADHLSHDLDKTTESYGWLRELRVGEGGIMEGRIEWTDIGAPAVRNKRFKFFSTEYDPDAQETLPDGRVRPLRLTGLALTNRPRRKGGRPISNRQETIANSQESPGQAGTQPGPKKTNMNTIAEKLGLPADANEEQILAAIAGMQSELDTLKKKAAEAAAESEAEAILNRNASRIPDGTREQWKAGLITNREATEKILVALPEKPAPATTEPARIFNREAARTPETQAGQSADESKTARLQAETVAAIRNRDKSSFQQAWETARREKPELFPQD